MIDVDNLFERRADNRWERTCAGDLFERNTWSRPDHEALVGMPGAFVDPAYERMTYRQADEAARRAEARKLTSALLGPPSQDSRCLWRRPDRRGVRLDQRPHEARLASLRAAISFRSDRRLDGRLHRLRRINHARRFEANI